MFRLFAALVTFVLLTPVADAERRPVPPVRVEKPAEQPAPAPAPASVTLREGVLAATLTFELGASKDAVMEPASIAPDVAYGVTDNFTFAIIHSSSALTGFRGSAGAGFCLTGTEAKCRATYAGGGVEALYSLTKGSAAVAANVGVVWPSLQPTPLTDLKLGLKIRLSEGRMFALLSPNVWLALDDRNDPNTPHEHQVWVPLGFWVKPTAALALGVGTGVKGPLEGFAQRMSIPAGLAVQYAVDPRVSIGSSFVFGKVYGGSAVMDAGVDSRAVQIWLNLTGT